MFYIALKFYIKIFHGSLLFILFFTCVYLFIKKKSIIRFLFLIGIFFFGAFRPQLYITDINNLSYLYANALFIDIGVLCVFISYIIAIKRGAL